MLYINIPISVLSSSEYRRCKPLKRATWLNLLGYCCIQENGGRIVGAADWDDREWQQIAAVTLEEVRMESTLWTWDGDDVVVWAYPAEQELVMRAKREGGVKGAAKRWAAKPDAETPIPPSVPDLFPSSVPDLFPSSVPDPVALPLPVAIGKEREGKEREVKERESLAHGDGEAIRRMVRSYGEASGKAPSGEAEKAAMRLIQAGEVTLDDLVAKVDAICTACLEVPLLRKGFLPRPYDLFAENGWLVSPEVYRATGMRAPKTVDPSPGTAPKRQDWQIRKDIDAVTLEVTKIRSKDANWRHYQHQPDPESDFTEPRKALKKAAAEEIAALTKRLDALNDEIKTALPN